MLNLHTNKLAPNILNFVSSSSTSYGYENLTHILEMKCRIWLKKKKKKNDASLENKNTCQCWIRFVATVHWMLISSSFNNITEKHVGIYFYLFFSERVLMAHLKIVKFIYSDVSNTLFFSILYCLRNTGNNNIH